MIYAKITELKDRYMIYNAVKNERKWEDKKMELDNEEEIATMENNGARVKKICKNCTFWQKKGDCKHYGSCNNPRFEYESAFCYEMCKEKQQAPILKDKLFYMDYEWYNADIEVGEEFGCIHFEKRK